MSQAATQSSNCQTIRILTWNANGIIARKNELQHFLHTENIDIALISETHLTSRMHVRFQGYILHPCHHPGDVTHGGSAILIKDSIVHDVLNNYATSKLQATCIALQINGIRTTVAAIYSPPRHAISHSEYSELFSHLGQHWIAGGDWNAKHAMWGSRLTSPKGRSLYEAILSNSLTCLSSGHPTYWPTDTNKRPDCIDFFLTKGVAPNYTETKNYADLSSDHSPILLQISGTTQQRKRSFQITNKRTDWEAFREILDKEIILSHKINSPTELEEAISAITKSIRDCFDHSSHPNIHVNPLLPQGSANRNSPKTEATSSLAGNP